MPHDQGPDYVLHLQSFLSAATEDLFVVYEPLAPVRLLQDLRERGIDWITIDEESYHAMGCNMLAVRPGVVVVVDGAPKVRKALEARGVEVHAYDGTDLSLKGDGGPTCLTAPLLRPEPYFRTGKRSRRPDAACVGAGSSANLTSPICGSASGSSISHVGCSHARSAFLALKTSPARRPLSSPSGSYCSTGMCLEQWM